MKQKKIIIIDANSLIHRAFHALPPLTAGNGEVVNAVYGFTTILLKAIKDYEPDYLACCFDVSKDTFRKQKYEEYKAHREEQPSELYDQFPLIKELLNAMKIAIYEKKGFEADDVIGTISQEVKKEKNLKTIIVSGDLDTLQLVDEKTLVYTLKKGISDTIIYDSSAVKERFGFEPKQMVDYKALRGDASDNIPGVKGIGEKTATSLIQEFGSLENLYKTIDNVDEHKDKQEELKEQGVSESVFKKLKDDKKQAFMSQELARIVRDVKVDFKLKDAEVEPFDTEKIIELFRDWKFNSLISRIPNAEKIMKNKQGDLFSQHKEGKNNNEKGNFKLKEGYKIIANKKDLQELVNGIKKNKEFAFDTELNGLNPYNDELIGISFSFKDSCAYYIAIKNSLSKEHKNEVNFFDLNDKTQEIESLKKIFSDEKVKKIAHNLKFDYSALTAQGWKINGLFFDTMLASYLLNPGSRQHNLDNLAFSELGYRMQSIQELSGQEKKEKINLAQINQTEVANYSCEDADITYRLYKKLNEKLDDEQIENVLQKIELPLIPVLSEMEKTGIKLDSKMLQKASKEIGEKINELEKKIYKQAGVEFNVASPKQLKEVLFEKMKISSSGLSHTKTGISTAAGELEKLKGEHKIIDLIIEHRELSKLKNTYLDPLPELVDKNNRIHTSFNQTVTATGRLSSSDPNLQNIPIRTELGKKVRQAFVAEKGNLLLAADYSQIELRIAASVSGDKNMIDDFLQDKDIHRETAARIFEVKPEKVDVQMRRQAKAVNFGIIYGQGAWGLAQTAGISRERAKEFIEKYFDVYSGVKEYLEETIALASELGYTETVFGRRRYIPEINANHQQLRSQAERMAINHPLQGTAADLIKLAMIKVNKKIKKEFANNQIEMLLQIHDELIFEIKKDLAEHAKKIIVNEMERVYKFKVPLKVDASTGKNWGECK